MELFREGSFSYRVLDAKLRDEALIVLSRAFCSEPVVDALGQISSDMKVGLSDWVEFVEYWMDHCATNGLSVIAVDEDNYRVAGVFIVRDLFYLPPGFDEKYGRATKEQSHHKALAPWMNFLLDLDALASQHHEPLQKAQLGEFVDFWFLGVHPDYRGRKIANQLIRGIIPLVQQAGYKYATIEATSYFTSQAARYALFKCFLFCILSPSCISFILFALCDSRS
jgi:ribosomal protein S18 acetylase RimI-like enzyme